MRSLVPAETLVYLETNDLAAALQPIVDSKPFTEVATSKPDFSALKGVQLAVAVTGFETSEERITDEQSVGRIQPRFVAVADTHAWNYQAVTFAEQKLGGFVEDLYDSEPKLEQTDAKGGKYFVWTAADGRKAYALAIESLIYFGNDESAIDKALAVRRGEADSIAKTNKIQPPDAQTLASGYVSTDGVAQIAGLAGLKFAKDASDDSEVQSAIANILPQLIRNTITDVAWTAKCSDHGYEDTLQVNIPVELSKIFYESMRPSGDLSEQREGNEQLIAQLPDDAESATRYNFKDPQIAWRSVLFAANDRLDAATMKFLASFSATLFEENGIRDTESFLNSLGDGQKLSKNIITARLRPDSEQRVVLAFSGDYALTQKSFVTELKRDWQGEDGWNGWKTSDGDLEVLFEDRLVTITQPEELRQLTRTRYGKPRHFPSMLLESSASIITVSTDTDDVEGVIRLFADLENIEKKQNSISLIETRFNQDGMERKTTSDFGFIGWIIAQMAQD